MKELVDSNVAAIYLHLARQTLARMRLAGTGPAYYKVGRRILYDRKDLDHWLDARRRYSTSDPEPVRIAPLRQADTSIRRSAAGSSASHSQMQT